MAAGPRIPSTARAAFDVLDAVILKEIDDAIERATKLYVDNLKIFSTKPDYEPDVRRFQLTPKLPGETKVDFLVIEKEFVHIYGFLWLLWGKKLADEIYYGHFIANKSLHDQFSPLAWLMQSLDAMIEFSPEELAKLDDFYNGGYVFINQQCGFIFVEKKMHDDIIECVGELEVTAVCEIEDFTVAGDKHTILEIFKRLCSQQIAVMLKKLENDTPAVKEGKRQRRE